MPFVLFEKQLNGEKLTGFHIVDPRQITTKSPTENQVNMFRYLQHDHKGRVLMSDAADRFIQLHSKRS